jgi:hypothetical protein
LASIAACAGGGPAAGDASADKSDASDAESALVCPQLSLTIAPREAPVGGEVSVQASLTPSAGPGVSYTWTASGGEFLSSIAASTRFSCTAPGPVVVTVQANSGACVETSSSTVQCDAIVLDAARPSGPCTFPGQTSCIPCVGSPGNLCTPTEIAFIQHDPTGACYACLLAAGCLDNADSGLAGNECDDLVGDSDAGPSAGAWKPSLCNSALQCILSTSCANPLASHCYCGTAAASACAIAGAANGPCLIDESAGLETTDPQTLLANFTSKSLAAGVANAIFACAAKAQCFACLGGTPPVGDASSGDAASEPASDAASD